ncbi:hypothetical protein GJ496_007378 [Pomphorhynchus laevis]|nr:hypothetical protein GJ496_007378 [Pomphorhynchus laevis]
MKFAILPIHMINDIHERFFRVDNRWYADEATFTVSVDDLLDLWEYIKEREQQYGYFPNDRKCKLLAHAPEKDMQNRSFRAPK